MPFENGGRLELKDQEKIKQKRRKYLEAMAAALGANPLTSKWSIEALLGSAEELSDIPYSNNRSDMDQETINKIEAIGRWYMAGSPSAEELKFAVGTHVLQLLKIDPNSVYFNNLKGFVGRWTDGEGDKKFDEVLSQEEK